jgi:hypothetical protein
MRRRSDKIKVVIMEVGGSCAERAIQQRGCLRWMRELIHKLMHVRYEGETEEVDLPAALVM